MAIHLLEEMGIDGVLFKGNDLHENLIAVAVFPHRIAERKLFASRIWTL